MKFKTTCRSQYSPWVKNVSKLLTIGVLFNGIHFNSFAGTLSPDTRYETFEGSNLTIPNVLEEDKVDVEIEGDTLVNIANTKTVEGTRRNGNLIITPTYLYSQFSITHQELMNKLNTTYTIRMEVLKNTSTVPITNRCYNGEFRNWTDIEPNFVGDKMFTYTTGSSYEYSRWAWFENHTVGEGEVEIRLTILEGDWLDKEIPPYFEGMKSVGQNDEDGHKIEILSQNKNLIDLNELLNPNNWLRGLYVSYPIKVKPNTNYSYSMIINNAEDEDGHRIWMSLFGKPNGYFDTVKHICWNWYGDNTLFTGTFNTGNRNTIYLSVYMWDGFDKLNTYFTEYIKNFQLEEGTTVTNHTSHLMNKKEILLNEPLRSLPNGVKDRIIKRNGQWMIERNCGEVVLDGSEDWWMREVKEKTIIFETNKIVNLSDEKNLSDNTINNVSNTIPVIPPGRWDSDEFGIHQMNVENIRIHMLKSKLKTQDIQGIKDWLSKNTTNFLYKLKTPIYEPLEIEPILNLYAETSHISNDSVIPATMNVTVDRILNRAVENIELAKTNPTMENLSRARMWINLVDDCSLKDQLQDEINSITDIDDLQLERKSASSNLDVYVKSENMLSMSLDTNSITFDGYSGTEDMEMLNAVNITINSSLPYSLNAYMPTEITNADKSETIPINILNIREESEGIYQTFTNNTDKVVLKDSCNAGNNSIHNIDLKLSSNQAHKADVYKTVIKFEAEQK